MTQEQPDAYGVVISILGLICAVFWLVVTFVLLTIKIILLGG